MIIEEIRAWRTSDGMLHLSMADAQKYVWDNHRKHELTTFLHQHLHNLSQDDCGRIAGTLINLRHYVVKLLGGDIHEH
jgi:hypothetical protein